MRRLLERAARDLVRRGIRDGLLGGNGIWLALGAVAWLLRWLSRTPTQHVVRETIRVGETITITSQPAPPFGRKARKLAKTEKEAAKAARRQVTAERKHAPELRAPAESGESEKRRDKKGEAAGGKGGRRTARA